MPRSALDDLADVLDQILAAESHSDDLRNGMSYSPAQMLDERMAVVVPFSLYNQHFKVLTWQRHSPYRGFEIKAVLYDSQTDLESLTDKVRSTDYIETHRLKSGDLANKDVADDTAHLLGTMLGYFTRYLLTGTNYQFRTSTHDDAPIDAPVP
jgi:hypothetical protein